MKKLLLLTILLLLVGCGQFHPEAPELENDGADYQYPTFKISKADFQNQLAENSLISTISDDGDGWVTYQSIDERIQVKAHFNDEGSEAMLVNFLIYEARPLKDLKLMGKVYPLLMEVMNLLDPDSYQKEKMEELITIRTIPEYVEGKDEKLTPRMLITTFILEDEEGLYLNIRMDPLHE